MKIQDSRVQLAAEHEARFEHGTEITYTQSFRQIFSNLAQPADDNAAEARKRVQKLLQSLLDVILAALDGKKCKENFAAVETLPDEQVPRRSAREVSWQNHVVQTVSESERTRVCGSGCVKTADGRQIEFDFSLNLVRDEMRTMTLDSHGTMELRDPLMLSFDGKACELSNQRIAFDLDADGKAEEIPACGAATGFLVFDRNGNGKADDGSELFGVGSGNGFADLTKLDDDHNGWVDENDAAWGRLGVWSGQGVSTLAERGVGALYTGAVEAPFTLKGDDDALLGQIRAAGLYLTEGGEVGHLQQVDLAVSGPLAGEQQPGERQGLTG